MADGKNLSYMLYLGYHSYTVNSATNYTNLVAIGTEGT